jgi:hypothetical protein
VTDMSLPHSSLSVWLPSSSSSADSQVPMIDAPLRISPNSHPLDDNSPQVSNAQVLADTLPQTHIFRIDPREGFFHAMLSYRVNSDKDFVTNIHNKVHLLGPGARNSQTHEAPSMPSNLDTYPWPSAFLRNKSVLNSTIRVFQDEFCLKDGKAWEGDFVDSQSGGFVGALKLSVVFVPLFSAKVDQDGRVLPVGSVGQMIDLCNSDKQDNVLLELILARELYLQSKQISKSTLLPCSQILPLFHSKAVWEAAKVLPKHPSKITNAKALKIMKSMGTPDSNISKELRSGMLTVVDVWSFYGQFQGIMLHDRGSEKYQIEAAAHAIIQSINEAVSMFKFHDLDMNYAQMYELFDFLSTLNMANYAKILACHKITNLFEFSSLNTAEDSVVKLIAEHGLQASDSTLAAELAKLRSAIAAAKINRYSKPLNDRFRDFIDEDASLVTLTQSASVVDNGLSKPFGLAVLFLLCFGFAIDSLAILHSVQNGRKGLYFPNNKSSQIAFYSCQPVFFALMCIAAIIAQFRSPRHGRYAIVFALIFYCCVYTWILAVSFSSAIENNCRDCANVDELVTSQNSTALNFLNQPFTGVPIAVASITMFFRQDLLLQSSIATIVLVNSLPGFVFFVYFRSFRNIMATTYFGNAYLWLAVFVVLKFLLHIGNRRAKQIYAMNEKKTLKVYESVRSEFAKSEEFLAVSVSSRDASSHREWYSIFRSLCCKLNKRRPSVAELQTFVPQPSDRSKQSLPINLLNVSAIWGQEIIGERTIYQLHSSFGSLVRDAEFINYPFQDWVSSWLTGGPRFDKIKKLLYHGSNGVATEFVNMFKCAVERVKLEAAFNCVLGEDVSDLSDPEAPLIARAGETLSEDVLCKLQSAGVKEIFVVSSTAVIRGVHKRGPVKHVDRAIAKVQCCPTCPVASRFIVFCRLTALMEASSSA